MSKANNLRKALADIEAKADRLAYARERVLEQLSKVEMQEVSESGRKSPVVTVVQVKDAPHADEARNDAMPVQKLDAVGATVWMTKTWTLDQVKEKCHDYRASYGFHSLEFDSTFIFWPLCVEPVSGASITSIFSNFRQRCSSSKMSIAGWGDEACRELRMFLDTAFGAGQLLGDLPS